MTLAWLSLAPWFSFLQKRVMPGCLTPRMAQPSITGTTHTLPFDRLSPRDFERLCLWLVEHDGPALSLSKGYERAEHLAQRAASKVAMSSPGARVCLSLAQVHSIVKTSSTSLSTWVLSKRPSAGLWIAVSW